MRDSLIQMWRRRYSFARARRNRLWLARVIVVDAIIPLTSLRGTFTRVRRASNPLCSISSSVRTPILAGRTVATRTRGGLIAMEYSSPASNPSALLKIREQERTRLDVGAVEGSGSKAGRTFSRGAAQSGPR